MVEYLGALARESPHLLSTCLWRILPFVLFALGSSRVSLAGRVFASVAYGALALAFLDSGGDTVTRLISHVTGLAYLTVGAAAVCVLAPFLRPLPGIRRLALFGALLGIFVLLPGMVLPEPAVFVAVPMGWEVALSAYSYLLDARAKDPWWPSLSDGLFFLIVDPTLVYRDRGKKLACPSASSGFWRCVLGGAAMALHGAILAVLVVSPLSRFGSATAGGLATLSNCVARALAGYAIHSGSASIQIGAMRLLGYEVPERYRYPWLANSPLDFWRRWNTYVGAWARRYLYFPSLVHLQQGFRLRRSHAAAAAILVTFSSVGVLHDFGLYAQYDVWPLGGLLIFTLHGVAAVSWALGRRALGRASARPLGTALSHACLAALLGLSVYIAIPTMSDSMTLTAHVVLRWIESAFRHA
jgi:hypothetical protein